MPRRLRRLDEDREQTDDDRRHAETFGERGKNDREATDLAGRIRISADRGVGQAGKDADADAGADDPECGESGADISMF